MNNGYCVHCMNKILDTQTQLCPRCGNPWNVAEQSPCCLKPMTMLHGKYVVGKKLSQGGFGITYNALDTALEVRVVIKEYYSRDSAYRIGNNSSQITWDTSGAHGQLWQNGKQSFIQEARKMAKIYTIPEIVRVLDTFEENNTAYIVMDYVDGITLRDKINSSGPMSFQSAVNMLRSAINAMGKIHSLGIIHRDISPNNIMVEQNGRLRILDLGAAKEIEESNKTMLLQRVVKRYYSPYEQYTHEGTGPYSDVYSMCGVLYFCVTGQDPQDSQERCQSDELSFPVDRFTPAEALVMRRGMAIQKEYRIQTMAELMSALETAEEQSEEETVLVTEDAEETGTGYWRQNEEEQEERLTLSQTGAIQWAEEKRKEEEISRQEEEEEEDYEDYEDEEYDEEETDDIEASPKLRKGTDSGDPVDQFNNGLFWYNNRGSGRNYEEAVKWFRLSADQGYAKAQNSLGVCYYNGRGVQKDYNMAVKWYYAAANQGNANAQYNLGVCYSNGHGVQRNNAEAAKWYFYAAEQGIVSAQSSLADCYKNGRGIQRNDAEAVKWYTLAADQGDAAAQCGLGICYYAGHGVQQDFAMAVKWFQKAAEKEDAVAQLNLGVCYSSGQGVPKNPAEAAKWYNRAASHGNAAAQYNLGICYSSGQGVPKNPAQSVHWYLMAANQGYASAQCNLGFCYYSGQGVRQNFSEAVKWYRLAAKQGVAKAQYNLGICYHYGHGVQRDYDEAEKWYRLAAKKGVAAAAEALKKLKKPLFGWR